MSTVESDTGSGSVSPASEPQSLVLIDIDDVDLMYDNPLDILRYYSIHAVDEKTRISAAAKLAEYEFHKKKALDDVGVEDNAVQIRMNIDTDVKEDTDRLPCVSDGQEVSQ